MKFVVIALLFLSLNASASSSDDLLRLVDYGDSVLVSMYVNAIINSTPDHLKPYVRKVAWSDLDLLDPKKRQDLARALRWSLVRGDLGLDDFDFESHEP